MALSKRGVRPHIVAPRPLVHALGHQEGQAGSRPNTEVTWQPTRRGGLSRHLWALDLAEAPRRAGALTQWSQRLRAMMPTLPPPPQLADGALEDIVVSGREVYFPRRAADSPDAPLLDQQYACSYIYARGPRPGDTPFGLLLAGCDVPGITDASMHDNPHNHLGHLHIGDDSFAVMVRSFRHEPMTPSAVGHKHSGAAMPQDPLIDVSDTVRSVRLALMARSLAYPQYVIGTPQQTHVVLPLCHSNFEQLSDHAAHLRLSFAERSNVLEEALAGTLFNLQSLHDYRPRGHDVPPLAFAHQDVRPCNMLVDLGFGGSLSVGNPAAPIVYACGRGLDVTLTDFALHHSTAWVSPGRYYTVQAAASDNAAGGEDEPVWFEPQRDDLFRLGRVAVGFFAHDTVPLGGGAVGLPYPVGDEFFEADAATPPARRERFVRHNRAIAKDYMQALQMALTHTCHRYGRLAADPLCLQPLGRLRDSIEQTAADGSSLSDLADDAESFERELAALDGAPVEGMVLRALYVPFLFPGPAILAEAHSDAATLRGLVSSVRPTRKHTPFRATPNGSIAFQFNFNGTPLIYDEHDDAPSPMAFDPLSRPLPIADDPAAWLEKRLRFRPRVPLGMLRDAHMERLAFDSAFRFRRTMNRPSGHHEARHFFSPYYLRYCEERDYRFVASDAAAPPWLGRRGIELNFYPKQPLFEPLWTMVAQSPAYSAWRRARPTAWQQQGLQAPFGALSPASNEPYLIDPASFSMD